MQYVSFTKRTLAMLIDLVVINVGVMLAGEIFLDSEKLKIVIDQAKTGMLDAESVQMLFHAAMVLSIASLVMVLLVDVILPATKTMASPGKQLLGVVVTDEHGKRLSFARIMARHAAKFVSFVTVIGFLMPLFSPKKQALHDKICGTIVIRRKGLGGLI